MVPSALPRHTVSCACAARSVVLVPVADVAGFRVVVDDLPVVVVLVESLGERTYWTCAACGQVVRGKRLIIKHVVGCHYPAAYRAASRTNRLPRPFTPPDDPLPDRPLAPPPSVALLNAWIHGSKPDTAAS